MNLSKIKDIRPVVIGTGSIGERHLRNMRTMGLGTIGVVTRNPNKKTRTINLNDFEVLSTFEEVRNFAPTHVVVCTPSYLHVEDVEKLSSVCKEFLIEIPSVCTTQQYNRLAKLPNVEIYSAFNLRFHPAVKYIARNISEKNEKPIQVRAQFGERILDHHSWDNVLNRYEVRSDLGGGALLTSCHELDLAQYFLGPYVNAIGMVDNLQLDIDCEDTGVVIGKHSSGAISQVGLDFWQPTYQRSLQVSTKDNVYYWDFKSDQVLTSSRFDDKIIRYDITGYDFNLTYISELDDFLSNKKSLPRLGEFRGIIKTIESVKNES